MKERVWNERKRQLEEETQRDVGGKTLGKMEKQKL
jgi:hypothetical protein